MADNVKPWWKSKTIWLNALAASLVVLESNTGLLQPLLPVNLYLVVAVALPALNTLLRAATSQGLALK